MTEHYLISIFDSIISCHEGDTLMFKGFPCDKTFVHWSVHVGNFSFSILEYSGSSLWSLVSTAIILALHTSWDLSPQVIHTKCKSHETWNLNTCILIRSQKTNGILNPNLFEYKSHSIFLVRLLDLFFSFEKYICGNIIV